MNLTDSQIDNVPVLSLEGRLDGLTSPQVDEKLTALAASVEKGLALDLSKLEYISSAGLRVLLMAAKKFNAAQKKLVFGAMPAGIKQILEISGFTSIFTIYPTTEEAARSIAA